jgi:CubicO group peptidase (beta-lactamase class C family)
MRTQAVLCPASACACGLLVSFLLFGQSTELDRDIPRLLTETRVPSVSIAQMKNGKVALVRAYGQQDAKTAATPASLYNIASLTKTITAQVAIRLVSDGVFALDEPMAPVWTDPDIAADERRNLLTPRIALAHQTGFANWRSMTKNKLTFQFTPGKGYGYSGEGFEYLAHFMEKKTGLPLDANARKLVFDPLEMRETAFTRQPWFQGRVATPADEEGIWLSPRFADHPISADMVYSTARDYALLLRAVIENRGIKPWVAKQRDTIQVSLKEKACPSLPSSALCPDALGSGLSWQIIRFKEAIVLLHTGHDPGVYTFTYILSTTHDGAVILTNGENGRKIIPVILRDLKAPDAFVALMKATSAK